MLTRNDTAEIVSQLLEQFKTLLLFFLNNEGILDWLMTGVTS